MTTKLNIPTTERGKTYWDGCGKYQAEYVQLWAALVPGRGRAKTLFGEVVRAAGRLQYEYFNNGNCNAASYNGIEIFYDNFLKLVRAFLQKNMPDAAGIVDKIENIILFGSDGYLEEDAHYYTLMIDTVIYIIKSKVNGNLDLAAEFSPEIPEWYKN